MPFRVQGSGYRTQGKDKAWLLESGYREKTLIVRREG